MVALSLTSVSRRFGNVHAVDNFSLDVATGEFVCLLLMTRRMFDSRTFAAGLGV